MNPNLPEVTDILPAKRYRASATRVDDMGSRISFCRELERWICVREKLCEVCLSYVNGDANKGYQGRSPRTRFPPQEQAAKHRNNHSEHHILSNWSLKYRRTLRQVLPRQKRRPENFRCLSLVSHQSQCQQRYTNHPKLTAMLVVRRCGSCL